MADELVQRIYLNEEHTVWADVYSSDDTFDDLAAQAADLIEEIENRGYFEPGFDIDNPNHYPDLPDEFDLAGPNTRGPFISNEDVQRWLDESGLEGQVGIFYDAEFNEFWIDADTSSYYPV
jgi:hypothetical protein